MIVDNKCQFCGSQVSSDHAFFIGEKLVKHTWTGWEYWESIGDGRTVAVKDVGNVTMVAKSINFGESQGDDDRPIFMIFEINGQYFRKNGTADSYGERDWSTGGFLPAVQKVIETKVWEAA